MNEPTIRATLPQAAELLLRWFKHELNDKDIVTDTHQFLKACGKMPERTASGISGKGGKHGT